MDPTIRIAGYDLITQATGTEHDITSQVSSVEITEEATILKRTVFGDSWHQKGRGLKSGTVKMDLYVDFEPDGIFDIMTDLWLNYELATFEVEDIDSGARVWGIFVVNKVASFSGAVDEYNTVSISFETTGEIHHWVPTS